MSDSAAVRTAYYDAALDDAAKERIKSVIERITYKPGWSFTAIEYNSRLYIEAYHTEIDSRTGDELPEFPRRIPINWPRYSAADDAGVAAWVRHCLHEWACHEVDEWLMLDGERFHDPHECLQCKVGGCRA